MAIVIAILIALGVFNLSYALWSETVRYRGFCIVTSLVGIAIGLLSLLNN